MEWTLTPMDMDLFGNVMGSIMAVAMMAALAFVAVGEVVAVAAGICSVVSDALRGLRRAVRKDGDKRKTKTKTKTRQTQKQQNTKKERRHGYNH